MVSPKNPEPTTTRPGLDKVETPDRVVGRQSSEGQGSNRESGAAREFLNEPDHATRTGYAAAPLGKETAMFDSAEEKSAKRLAREEERARQGAAAAEHRDAAAEDQRRKAWTASAQ